MERIEKAIERARKSAKKAAGKTPIVPTPPTSLQKDAVQTKDTQEPGTKQVVTLDPIILEDNKIVAHDKSDIRSIPYDQLRTHVLQTMSENNWQTLAITSPTEACGKTVTAINLAFAIARSADQTVLLIDFDLRRPTLAQYLGIEERAGLSDFLDQQATLQEVMITLSIDRLSVIPNFKTVDRASEILGSSRTRTLIDDLRSKYKNRIIIFDLPPLLTSDDVVAFLPAVDSTLLIASSGKTVASEIENSKQLLGHHPLVGAVMNFGEINTKSYY